MNFGGPTVAFGEGGSPPYQTGRAGRAINHRLAATMDLDHGLRDPGTRIRLLMSGPIENTLQLLRDTVTVLGPVGRRVKRRPVEGTSTEERLDA